MDRGEVAECGSPLELLKADSSAAGTAMNRNAKSGIFRSFVDGLGPEKKASFIAVASKRFRTNSSKVILKLVMKEAALEDESSDRK